MLLLPPAPAALVDMGRSLSADLEGRLAARRLSKTRQADDEWSLLSRTCNDLPDSLS